MEKMNLEQMISDDKLYLLVVGSRSFNNFELLYKTLEDIVDNNENVVIVSGGARGADTLAKQYAELKKFEYKEFPANWDLYGKSAGYRRNEQMHQFIADKKNRMCIAFWDGKSVGTKHNFVLSEQYNNKLKIIRF